MSDDDHRQWLAELREHGESGFAGMSAQNVARVLALADAVAAREAALRGALAKLSRQVEMHHHSDMGRSFYPDHACGQCMPGGEAVRADFLCGRHEALAALAGAGPDYVPKAQLDEALAKVRALQAALDALEPEHYATGATVAAYLEANGLRRPEPSPFSRHDDEALLLELVRRGYVGALNERPVGALNERSVELRLTEDEIRALMRHGPKVPPYSRLTPAERALVGAANAARPRLVFCPHCNDLPYDGPTLACPACGIDRHGAG